MTSYSIIRTQTSSICTTPAPPKKKVNETYLKVHFDQLICPFYKKSRAYVKMESREALLLGLETIY